MDKIHKSTSGGRKLFTIANDLKYALMRLREQIEDKIDDAAHIMVLEADICKVIESELRERKKRAKNDRTN